MNVVQSLSDYVPEHLHPPHNIEAEQALLGAILANNTVLERVGHLTAEAFYHPVHQKLYTTIKALVLRGVLASAISVKDAFKADELVDLPSGTNYFAVLTVSVVTIMNASSYATVILDTYLRRCVIDACRRTISDAHEPALETPAREIIERLQTEVGDIEQSGSPGRGLVPIGEAVQNAIEEAEAAHKLDGKLAGATYGLHSLDNRFGGMHPGDLIVMGGRSGHGKSLVAGTILKRTALAGNPAFAASLEMTAEQWAARYLAEDTGISAQSLRRGSFEFSDMDRLIGSGDRYDTLPIWVDDTPNQTMDTILQRIRTAVRKHKIRVAVIDHLHIIKRPKTLNSGDIRHQLGDIAKDSKAIAKELGITVVLLAQLLKSVDRRDDRRPTLADLAESGDVEPNADIIMFLYREERYLQKEFPRRLPKETQETFNARIATHFDNMNRVKNRIEIIVSKNRHGEEAQFYLAFDGARSCVNDLPNDGIQE